MPKVYVQREGRAKFRCNTEFEARGVRIYVPEGVEYATRKFGADSIESRDSVGDVFYVNLSNGGVINISEQDERNDTLFIVVQSPSRQSGGSNISVKGRGNITAGGNISGVISTGDNVYIRGYAAEEDEEDEEKYKVWVNGHRAHRWGPTGTYQNTSGPVIFTITIAE